MINDQQDMLAFLEADSIEEAKRHVYKSTACGAWIEFQSNGVQVGSIVEGCACDCTTYMLRYPFSEDDYNKRISAIENEADALWNWANVPKDVTGRRNPQGKTDAERGIDAPIYDNEASHA